MRYFVVAEDGGKFGPAELSLLNQWIEEGRLSPEMTLVEDGSNRKVIAASILGLDFDERGEAPPNPMPGPVAVLEREPIATPFSDVILSFSMVAITLALSPVKIVLGYLGIFTAILGCMAAMKAKERLDALAGPALVLNVLAFVVWLSIHLVLGLR